MTSARRSESTAADETLVRSFVETRSDRFFIELYGRYADKVYRRCLSFCQNTADAEDLVQDVFTRVFLSLHTFRGEASFSTWLYRVTSNRCLNFLRDRKVFASLEDVGDLPGPTISDPTGPIPGARDLPVDAQALLLLKYREGYTYQEIAASTGLGVSAIKMRIARAKALLKETYTNAG